MRTHLATLIDDFRRHGGQTAVVVYSGNRRRDTSYVDLAKLVSRFSAEIVRRDVRPGERVVIWGHNSAEWIAAFFGCVLRGVIAVPLDAAGSAAFAARVVLDVAPRLIVGDMALLHLLEEGPSQLSFGDFSRLLPKESLASVDASIGLQTPLQIIFTSGTTSDPKGVVHTHANVLASLQPIELEIQKYRKYERLVHPLRILHCLPLSHVFGQFMGLWIPALLAAEVHFDSRVEPARMMTTIRKERISVLAAVPRVLQLLRSHVEAQFAGLATVAAERHEQAWKRWWRFRALHRAFGLKFWAIVCGGAALPAQLEEFWNTLGFALIQGYGLTETTALVTLNHPFQAVKGTIGKPLPGREIRLDGNGEILVRGPMLSTATWERGALRSREGEWLATGDLATRDATGELRFVGRGSDIIVSASGMNIHAADVEGKLLESRGLQACVVAGCQAVSGVELVAIVIFPGPDEELQKQIRETNGKLEEYQQIRRWLRWPDLSFPYTSTGKLLRRQVVDWACATLLAQSAGEEAKIAPDALLMVIKTIVGDLPPEVSNDSLLSEDFHLDSLGSVQLQSSIEQQLGIELADAAFAETATLGQLRQLLGIGGTSAGGSQTLGDDSSLITKGLARKNESHQYLHWPWFEPVRLFRGLFVELVLRPLVWLLAAPHVICDCADSDEPLLVIANHVSTYDAALVLYGLLPQRRRRLAIAMSGELLMDLRKGRNQASALLNILAPPAYWLLTVLFNVFPLPRSGGYRRSFAHAGEALDNGYSVLIFPEGQRSPNGEQQPFRQGIGLLTEQSQVAVLPVGLRGLGEMKRGETNWFRSRTTKIHVGPALFFSAESTAEEITTLLEKTIREL